MAQQVWQLASFPIRDALVLELEHGVLIIWWCALHERRQESLPLPYHGQLQPLESVISLLEEMQLELVPF